MRVAYLGGGTGGHLAPGIGVAEALGSGPEESLFLVAGRGVERAMLAPRRLRFVELFGDRGRPAPWRLDLWARATGRLAAALKSFDPEVLVLLGGWVALPALWLPALGPRGRRPTVLVEPNAVPGKVGRWLDRKVDHTCLAAEGPTMPRGRRSTTVTGVPGPTLQRWSRQAAAAHFGLDPARRTLLVTGGSQGARDLNRLVPAVRQQLARELPPWQLLHISGAAGTDGAGRQQDGSTVLGASPPPLPPAADLDTPPVLRRSFLTDMAPAWALADLALCRAGSGTCHELAGSGTPAVLVPYPYHRDQHQRANAARLLARGAAWMVGEDDPRGERTAVELLGRAVAELESLTVAARGAAQEVPAQRVAAVVRRAGRADEALG